MDIYTADFVAQAIERAVEKSNMPKGVFNMIYGNGVGEPLVKHPLIQAVGFTGSLRGGRALCDILQPVHNRFRCLLK